MGGGSSGWMTAATLQSQFPNYSISLIESKNIKTIGVGESTLGQINNWLRLLKINYKDFLTKVEGSLKYSIKFTDFYKKGQSFHYPFGKVNLLNNKYGTNDWWFKKIVYPQTPLSDFAECMFPLQMAYTHSKKFSEEIEFAYHFDAIKFGIWLKDYYCTKVNHIVEDVNSIQQDENGIVSLNNKYKADLFIDCTGFKSILLGETLKEPFESYQDMLPNDSAWATKIPYKNKEQELVPYTNCTAIENGWVWNIPSWERIGTGYVYSSKFVDDKTALKQFQNHLGTDQAEFKNIKMKVGIHNRLWVKNVVAIGLSAGFIEPLESNGLFSVHEFLFSLVRHLKREKFSQLDRDSFNFYCKKIFKSFAEFVGLHYALSHRTDTEYWKNNFNKKWADGLINFKDTSENGFVDFIKEKNFLYQYHPELGSQCIAAGMDFAPTELMSMIRLSNQKNEDQLKEEFRHLSNALEIKKNNCLEKTKNKPTLYEHLQSLYSSTKIINIKSIYKPSI